MSITVSMISSESRGRESTTRPFCGSATPTSGADTGSAVMCRSSFCATSRSRLNCVFALPGTGTRPTPGSGASYGRESAESTLSEVFARSRSLGYAAMGRIAPSATSFATTSIGAVATGMSR